MARGGSDGKEANDTKPAAGPVTYQFAIKPEEKPGWEGFKAFLWNSETSEFLGRTASSWLKIGVFYVIYYLFLAGFFIAMLLIFNQTLKDDQPKWHGNDGGIIGDNPGLGYRPKPPNDKIESTLLFFRHGGTGNWKSWKQRLDDYLEPYQKISATKNNDLVDCNFDDLKPGEGQYCKVAANDLFVDQCQNATNYGYEAGAPCILLKLNRIYGWNPKPYKNVTDLPEKAPTSLKTQITELTTAKPKMMGQMVWLSCEGENPADKENIGDVAYYPYPGFPSYHYPYTNQPDYLSPAVFAHLKNPKRGVLISIECKAWADNIEHDPKDRTGSVHFEVMID